MKLNEYAKKFFLNEYLKDPFLKAKEDKKQELSTTRSNEDLMDSLAFASEDTFISMNANRGWADYISIWRRLFAHNIEVEEAVTEIVNEAIVADTMDDIIKLDWKNEDLDKAKRKKIQEEWETIYGMLNLSEDAPILFQRSYIDAVLVAELIYDNKKLKDGIQRIDILEPKNLVLDQDTKTGKQILRRVLDTSNYNIVRHSDKIWTEEQFVMTNSGLFDPELKIYLSYLNYAVRPVNQLNSIENALIVYALTRSTEKLVYYVDVGDLNHNKASAKIQDVARKYSSNLKYDSSSGNIINTKDKIKLSKEIFLGTRGGERGTTVDTISSDQMNIGELPILEYFQDKLYRTLKVPRLRRQKDAMFNFGDSTEVEREEINFYKFVVRLRNHFNPFLKDILKKQCISKGLCTLEQWENEISKNILFVYANNNNYEELKKIASLRAKIELLDSVKEYTVKNEQGEIIFFSSKYIKDNILKFTQDEIDELDKQIEDDMKKAKPTADEPTAEEGNNPFGENKEEKDEMFEELSGGELAVDLSLEDYEKIVGGMKEGDEIIPVDSNGNQLPTMLYTKGKLKIKK